VPVIGVNNAKDKAAADQPAPKQSRLGNRGRKLPPIAPPLPAPDPERVADAQVVAESAVAPGSTSASVPPLAPPNLGGSPGPLAASREIVSALETFPGSPGSVLSPGLESVEVAGLLHELTAELLSADDLPQALDRLAVFIAATVPSVLRCSVTLITEGMPLSRAAAGTPGQALDDLQYSAGQGPGLDAARTRELITVQDLPADARWPELGDCARAQGVHSVAAIPLDVRRSSVGSVSLFVAGPHGIVPELLLTAMAIVSQAEILLGELGRRAALSEGATVDRAAGVIIAQRGCGVREAYGVLRDTAQRLGMDRRAVAERLIAAAAARARTPEA
jgi:hypothetical protein